MVPNVCWLILCERHETGGIDHPMPRMRLSAAGQRTSMDGLPQIGGHYVLAFLQGWFGMLMNVDERVGLANCGILWAGFS